MFPVIGLLSAIAAALGLYGLIWYEGLSKEDKEKADRLASQYAMSLFHKSVDQLTAGQFSKVQAAVRQHFGGE